MGTNKKPLRPVSVTKRNSPKMGTNTILDVWLFSPGITPASKFNFEFNEDLEIYEVFECLERDKQMPAQCLTYQTQE